MTKMDEIKAEGLTIWHGRSGPVYTCHRSKGLLYLDGGVSNPRKGRAGPFESIEVAAQYTADYPEYWKSRTSPPKENEYESGTTV